MKKNWNGKFISFIVPSRSPNVLFKLAPTRIEFCSESRRNCRRHTRIRNMRRPFRFFRPTLCCCCCCVCLFHPYHGTKNMSTVKSAASVVFLIHLVVKHMIFVCVLLRWCVFTALVCVALSQSRIERAHTHRPRGTAAIAVNTSLRIKLWMMLLTSGDARTQSSKLWHGSINTTRS